MRLIRLGITLVSAIAILSLSGCATTPATTATSDIPGVSAYYAKATEHHTRPFRKTYRDQRETALRELAKATDRVLDEAQTWDSDARLVALAEPQRDAKRAAVEEFRAALRELKTSAEKSNLSAVRTNYARTLGAYRQVADVAQVGE